MQSLSAVEADDTTQRHSNDRHSLSLHRSGARDHSPRADTSSVDNGRVFSDDIEFWQHVHRGRLIGQSVVILSRWRNGGQQEFS